MTEDRAPRPGNERKRSETKGEERRGEPGRGNIIARVTCVLSYGVRGVDTTRCGRGRGREKRREKRRERFPLSARLGCSTSAMEDLSALALSLKDLSEGGKPSASSSQSHSHSHMQHEQAVTRHQQEQDASSSQQVTPTTDEEDFTLSSDSAHSSSFSSRASSNRGDRDETFDVGVEEREIGTQTSLNSTASSPLSPRKQKGVNGGDGGNQGEDGATSNARLQAGSPRERSRSASGASSDGDSEEFYVDNPTPQIIPPPVETGAVGEKHVIVMVGLPARGKTHMARRLAR